MIALPAERFSASTFAFCKPILEHCRVLVTLHLRSNCAAAATSCGPRTRRSAVSPRLVYVRHVPHRRGFYVGFNDRNPPEELAAIGARAFGQHATSSTHGRS